MFDSENKKLINQVKKKQNEMIKVGLEKGLQHEETLKLSQQLDKLITKVQKKSLN
ncbi:Spo0E like sporulation regulatory protein [Oceanobacillus limi]|uniref:Spo0E like sporulation regulatory protein n=1 Tax=Oceanobacillus limi TaxID=930131 RepID=A0A1I0CI96_9BACI|nr:aspartyl-phosphate phosphatase Spo0E family protein [Oceanobacillus limi]SET19140.1 Spo0E like sporulation regulatory protein [Oceanobacillus limi]